MSKELKKNMGKDLKEIWKTKYEQTDRNYFSKWTNKIKTKNYNNWIEKFTKSMQTQTGERLHTLEDRSSKILSLRNKKEKGQKKWIECKGLVGPHHVDYYMHYGGHRRGERGNSRKIASRTYGTWDDIICSQPQDSSYTNKPVRTNQQIQKRSKKQNQLKISIALPYINNKHFKKEIRKQFHLQ